jgi:class 3 adenylate cyclase
MGELLPDGPVTILFSDVEGSTDLRTERGDTVAHRILRAHEEVVRDCVSAHDGREVKALGDGFMLAFSSPGPVHCATVGSIGGRRGGQFGSRCLRRSSSSTATRRSFGRPRARFNSIR